MLGTSDAWLMSRSSQRPSNPAYYIEDCRIFSDDQLTSLAKAEDLTLKTFDLQSLASRSQQCFIKNVLYRMFFTNFTKNIKLKNILFLACSCTSKSIRKKTKNSCVAVEYVKAKEKWYFVTKIVLTYCEKKMFQ